MNLFIDKKNNQNYFLKSKKLEPVENVYKSRIVSISEIIIFQLGLAFCLIPFISTTTCDPSNKMKYGGIDHSESICTQQGGCHESGFGCYFSQEFIPGFRIARGGCGLPTSLKILSNLPRKECARECLKRFNCNSFTYVSSSKECHLNDYICYQLSYLDDGNFTYNRYASKKAICSLANCQGLELNNSYKIIEDCYQECEQRSDCKVFLHLTTTNGNRVCIIKPTLCDFTLPQNSITSRSVCIPGPAFPDWLNNHYSNRADISDDSTSTCKSVGSEDNFNLKIPWPTVGEGKPDFNITIIGTNLRNCINFNSVLLENGVGAFVVYEFKNKPQFTGNFKACQLISGNNNTECKYSCSCGLDYCEAVHIRAFASNEINMSICHYQVSQD